MLGFQVFGVDLQELADKQKGSFILTNRLDETPDDGHLQWQVLASSYAVNKLCLDTKTYILRQNKWSSVNKLSSC